MNTNERNLIHDTVFHGGLVALAVAWVVSAALQAGAAAATQPAAQDLAARPAVAAHAGAARRA